MTNPTTDDQITVITGPLPGEMPDDYCPTCGHWLGMPHHNGQPCQLPPTGEDHADA